MSIFKKMSEKRHALSAMMVLLSSTIIGSLPVFILGLLKLFPNEHWKVLCTKQVDKIATLWCDINNIYVNKIHPARWEITGFKDFNPNDWYLVVANHQSWLDIVVLQRLFNRKIPVLKFFIKDQLKWVPFLGFSWWAMGCPFMKRYSQEYIAKYPHKKGQDLEATKKALKLFKKSPATIMSFVEGTRYTPEKKIQQQSPYQHLLKPKAGGVSFVIDAMCHKINHFLDVTIIYPDKQHSLWDFLCQRVNSIKIHIREIPIPNQFLESSLIDNEQTQIEFRQWLNDKWSEKDHLIGQLQR